MRGTIVLLFRNKERLSFPNMPYSFYESILEDWNKGRPVTAGKGDSIQGFRARDIKEIDFEANKD